MYFFPGRICPLLFYSLFFFFFYWQLFSIFVYWGSYVIYKKNYDFMWFVWLHFIHLFIWLDTDSDIISILTVSIRWINFKIPKNKIKSDSYTNIINTDIHSNKYKKLSFYYDIIKNTIGLLESETVTEHQSLKWNRINDICLYY